MAKLREINNDNIQNTECQICNDVDVTRCLDDITFVRIHLENLYMNEEDEFINEIIRRRSLFGFVLEYQFPSLDPASYTLKTRVRINARSFSGNMITFRHRRVIRIKITPESIALWKRSSLVLNLNAKLNTLGKFSIKKIGTCVIPLGDLVNPPFIICRDFLFTGPGFSASALIKIDLGSHVKLLMDRLEAMRGDECVHRTRIRSRSSSRQGSSKTSSRNISPVRLRSRSASKSSNENAKELTMHLPLNLDTSTSPSLSPSPTSHSINIVPRICPMSPSYPVTLTVHCARRLPLSQNKRGEAVVPSTYVTVIGEDGRILTSPVRVGTLNPEWNWTETFNVSRSRQNLVVKLWKRTITGLDNVIGFVSLKLPPKNIYKCEYEMSDLSVTGQVPIITISFSRSDRYENNVSDEESIPQIRAAPPKTQPLMIKKSPRLQKMTREEVFEKLRRNISELEQMMMKLKEH